jgi:hypothetical protein
MVCWALIANQTDRKRRRRGLTRNRKCSIYIEIRVMVDWATKGVKVVIVRPSLSNMSQKHKCTVLSLHLVFLYHVVITVFYLTTYVLLHKLEPDET